ncbi:MAG: hypothetical protein IJW16_01105 [Clostridia bacterium]|nr:hypothetical protein [Clostridia bacterium]
MAENRKRTVSKITALFSFFARSAYMRSFAPLISVIEIVIVIVLLLLLVWAIFAFKNNRSVFEVMTDEKKGSVNPIGESELKRA